MWIRGQNVIKSEFSRNVKICGVGRAPKLSFIILLCGHGFGSLGRISGHFAGSGKSVVCEQIAGPGNTIMQKEPIIQAKDLARNLNGELLFSGLDISVQSGEKIALVGDSGTGKSTVLNMLMGFEEPDEGSVQMDGSPVTDGRNRFLRERVAWLPQKLDLKVGSASALFHFPFQFKRNQGILPDKGEIGRVLRELGLSLSILDKGIDQISGGEQQRLILASIGLLKRDLYILDEPVSALDETNQERVIDHFLRDPGKTVIASVHRSAWTDASDRVIELGKPVGGVKASEE